MKKNLLIVLAMFFQFKSVASDLVFSCKNKIFLIKSDAKDIEINEQKSKQDQLNELLKKFPVAEIEVNQDGKIVSEVLIQEEVKIVSWTETNRNRIGTWTESNGKKIGSWTESNNFKRENQPKDTVESEIRLLDCSENNP